MSRLMRCPYCGHLQDEPAGVKECARCGGILEYERQLPGEQGYLQVQMELDQVAAPANLNVERYLLVTIRAPREVPAAEGRPEGAGRAPINFAAVLDVSGSMQGEKIANARAAVRQAIRYLRQGDIFSLVTFSSQVACPFEPGFVDRGTTPTLDSALDEIQAGGMTALDGGLELGIEKALVRKQDTNHVLLLSDGQANVGVTDLELIGQRAFQARQGGMTVSSLGVGLDYNEALLAEIATQGGGRFYHLSTPHEIPAYLAGELGEVIALAARDVVIGLNIPEGATLVPLTAAYPVQQNEGRALVSVGDIPCDTELEVPLRLAFLGQSEGKKLSIAGELTFQSPAGNKFQALLNRVTVRFFSQPTFTPRQGVVVPVVERVLDQMRAVHVLDVARAIAHQPQIAEKQADGLIRSYRSYAELLGEERAEVEARRVAERFSALRADRVSSKRAVADAFMAVRASKKHQ